jgi:hypothetical protein
LGAELPLVQRGVQAAAGQQFASTEVRQQVELLLVPQCPHANRARTVLARCLDEAGLTVPVVERVGDYPSPTVLVNGVDVMTGSTGIPHAQACRLDLPTPERVLAVLRSQASAG